MYRWIQGSVFQSATVQTTSPLLKASAYINVYQHKEQYNTQCGVIPVAFFCPFSSISNLKCHASCMQFHLLFVSLSPARNVFRSYGASRFLNINRFREIIIRFGNGCSLQLPTYTRLARQVPRQGDTDTHSGTVHTVASGFHTEGGMGTLGSPLPPLKFPPSPSL